MADEVQQEKQADEVQQEKQDAPVEKSAPVSKGDKGLRAELERLESRRADLKKKPKDQLKDGEYAEVKNRIAEIKKALGE